MAGSAGDPLIRVDNVAIAKLDNGRYFSLNIPAGPHLIHAKWGFAKSDVSLDLQAGETVFLAFDAGTFQWTFLDPRQGRNDIRQLNPLDANKIIDKDRVEREIRLD